MNRLANIVWVVLFFGGCTGPNAEFYLTDVNYKPIYPIDVDHGDSDTMVKVRMGYKFSIEERSRITQYLKKNRKEFIVSTDSVIFIKSNGETYYSDILQILEESKIDY